MACMCGGTREHGAHGRHTGGGCGARVHAALALLARVRRPSACVTRDQGMGGLASTFLHVDIMISLYPRRLPTRRPSPSLAACSL